MELNEPFVDEPDSGELDLTPRTAPAVGGGRGSGGRRVVVVSLLGVLLVVLGVVAWQGLTNATTYFRNADEAVAERDELGDRRFRLQGSVVDGSVTERDGEVRFAVEYGGVSVDVRHIGDPPELFQVDIPVVLEGRWSDTGDWFASDRILVKHSSEYREDNPDRVDDYVDDAGESGADGSGEE